MTKEQFKKANKAVFPVLMVVMGYIALTMLLTLTDVSSGTPWRVAIQFIVTVICMIGCTIFFVTKRQEKMGAYGMLLFAMISYLTV